jgi:hypothetical protein
MARPLIDGIVLELLARHQSSGRVDLNDIAEVIDARAVTYEEVDEIITRLESQGLRVGDTLTEREVDVLRSVVAAARRLDTTLRRRPTVEEIAAESGHSAHAVRRALEHGGRPARVLRGLGPALGGSS